MEQQQPKRVRMYAYDGVVAPRPNTYLLFGFRWMPVGSRRVHCPICDRRGALLFVALCSWLPSSDGVTHHRKIRLPSYASRATGQA
eukprot:3364203-Pyramimonas_sp.AAC.1